MGLKIGKFLGRVATGLVKSAPSALAGYATAGPGGASLALLGGLTTSQKTSGVGATPASFAQPSSSFPGRAMATSQVGGGQAMTVSNRGLASTANQSVYTAAVDVLGKLNILPRDPNAVLRNIRPVLAKMLRFSRVNPGLTVISMLINLGILATAANELVSWYATAGKKRRRMRVTNVKALRRSVRRLESFHKLARKVEASLSHSRPRRVSSRRCGSCKKNPCSC
jgi:hypothetical protein